MDLPTTRELYPGRTLDPHTQCWIAPGLPPVTQERMRAFAVILDDLRARSRSDPGPGRPAFTCPRCGAVSYNANDLAHRYCGRCHAFVDDPAPPAGPRP